MDSVNKSTLGIIAWSLAHCVVNKDSNMVEMLLRSCWKKKKFKESKSKI